MKLTPTQYAILDHRLSAETIPEVLASTVASEAAEKVARYGTDGWNAVYDRVESENLPRFRSAHTEVIKMIEKRDLPLETLTPDQLAVAIDCLEGSTFFADWEDRIACGESTKSKLNTAHKAADQLESALSVVAGRDVECVRN